MFNSVKLPAQQRNVAFPTILMRQIQRRLNTRFLPLSLSLPSLALAFSA